MFLVTLILINCTNHSKKLMQTGEFDPTDDVGIDAINNAKAVLEVIIASRVLIPWVRTSSTRCLSGRSGFRVSLNYVEFGAVGKGEARREGYPNRYTSL